MKERLKILLAGDVRFVCYTGMETDLIFNKKVELPEFAAFPLMEIDQGIALINDYYRQLIALALENNVGVILESVTWVANKDRAAKLGYGVSELAAINVQAVTLMEKARDAYGDAPTLLSANIGPRGDAYNSSHPMQVAEARKYHAAQINSISTTQADFITAYTLAYVDEAIGMVLAARAANVAIVVAFTVETDGRLPSGMAVAEAIEQVDQATDDYALYYMINCAHPSHFTHILTDVMPRGRLKGLVMNASSLSHAELDCSTNLDNGNPMEFGQSVRRLCEIYPQLNVIGGCCGTDMRHLREMLL